MGREFQFLQLKWPCSFSFHDLEKYLDDIKNFTSKISTKLNWHKVSFAEGISCFSNEGPCSFSREENNNIEIEKMHR